jgi:hypothetical protein
MLRTASQVQRADFFERYHERVASVGSVDGGSHEIGRVHEASSEHFVLVFHTSFHHGLSGLQREALKIDPGFANLR